MAYTATAARSIERTSNHKSKEIDAESSAQTRLSTTAGDQEPSIRTSLQLICAIWSVYDFGVTDSRR